jgi:hypothetical protein
MFLLMALAQMATGLSLHQINKALKADFNSGAATNSAELVELIERGGGAGTPRANVLGVLPLLLSTIIPLPCDIPCAPVPTGRLAEECVCVLFFGTPFRLLCCTFTLARTVKRLCVKRLVRTDSCDGLPLENVVWGRWRLQQTPVEAPESGNSTNETWRLRTRLQPPQLSRLRCERRVRARTWQRQHRGSALVDLDGGVDLADEQEAAEEAGEATEHEDAVAHDEHVAEVDGRR